MYLDNDAIMRAVWFARSTIGKPWIEGAVGPDSFDCLGLTRACQRAVFDRELPVIDVRPGSALEVARAIRNHPSMQLWPERETRRHGDVMTMEVPGSPGHIGTFLDIERGGVLHCISGFGVQFHAFAMLPILGWTNIRYYRPTEAQA